jgi:signal transduction histidine kinase
LGDGLDLPNVLDVYGGNRNQGAAYVGADRRQTQGIARSGPSPREVSLFALALLIAGALMPLVLATSISPEDAHMVVSSLRSVAATFFVGAGLLRLARWRLTGEARLGYAGAALTVFGLVTAPLALYAAVVQSTPEAVILSPVSRTMAVICFLIIVIRAVSATEVDSALGPLRLITSTVLPLWVGYIGLMVVAAVTGPLDMPNHVWFGVEVVLTAAWAWVCAWVFKSARSHHSASLLWSGFALAAMGLCEFARAIAFLDLYPAALSAVGLQLVAAGVVAANSARDLSEVFSANGNRLLSVTGALAQTERVLAAEEERRDEQVHDARSVIAALSAASVTLARYGERLRDDQKAMLQSAFSSELARLQHLIDPRERTETQDFWVDEALLPVLAAERALGTPITAGIDRVRAHGHPLDLATVVQNLLVNARRYAGGSGVLVRAERLGDAVHIYVQDRGPGIPPDEYDSVFERGFRGSAGIGVRGSGLGLYVARKLMVDQGGQLRVEERPGGGASFVISLRAGSQELVQQPRQVEGVPHVDQLASAVTQDAAGLPGLTGQGDHHTSADRRLLVDDRQIDSDRVAVNNGQPAHREEPP